MVMAASANQSISLGLRSCKVLIVGAGMAGLSAANHLLKNSEPDFLIVEARSRIGGRILATRIGGEKVELGANWIYGVLGNPIFELAVTNDLISIMSIPRPHKIAAAMEDGKRIPFTVLEEIYTAYVCFLRRCEEYFLSSYNPPEGINNVGEHIVLETNLYLASLSAEDRKIRQLLFDCLLKRETCITGCDNMEEIDLIEMGSYTELQGGNISLPEGYSCILEPVCKFIPKDRILTQHAITKIRWQTDSEDISSGLNDAIQVECDNGNVIICEQVICTLPLGVLKECAAEIFEPSLSTPKLQAINRLMFGTVDKIILEYDRPFLNPDISEIMLLWDDRKLAVEEASDPTKSWFRKIYSFTKLSETLLLGWISGKAAEYMENLDSDEVARVCTNILRSFLNDPFIPVPKNCTRSCWHSQPYTRGSYTSIAVGSSQLDIESLAEPLTKPGDSSKLKIAFAGEHTHSSFYSTVHGAYLSGRTAAQAVLESRRWERQTSFNCDDTNDYSSWIQGIRLN